MVGQRKHILMTVSNLLFISQAINKINNFGLSRPSIRNHKELAPARPDSILLFCFIC